MRTMILHSLLLGLIGIAWPPPVQAAPAPSENPANYLFLRCHFVGLNRLLADPDAAKLKQVWSLPATADVRKQVLDRMARLPHQALSGQLPKGASNQMALFRPLLEDLLPSESFLELRGTGSRPSEFVLAVQLSDDRARVWRTHLEQALNAWKLGEIAPAKPQAGEGWIFKPRNSNNAFAYTRAGQWVVLGIGSPNLPLHAEILKRIQADGRPAPKAVGNWLEADANLARLKPYLPPLAPYQNLPLVHLSLSNHADYVRTSARVQFLQPHGWRNENWLIPTSLIRDPLISFTAMQGIAPLLAQWKFFQQLRLEPMPNQTTVWSQANIPFLTQVAVPLKNAGPQLARLAPRLPSLVLSNSAMPLPGTIEWNTNFQAVVWKGLPIAMPQLSAIKDQKSEYLVFSLFPRLASTNLPPPELFKQVEGRTNLVYYDWEITEARLKQWRPLYQLMDIATHHRLVRTNAPTQRWISSLAPLLGNTITELESVSPTEFSLVRKSHCGLTGFELLSLTRWLDSPEFPKFSLVGQPGPTISRQPKRAPKRTGAH